MPSGDVITIVISAAPASIDSRIPRSRHTSDVGLDVCVK
jgi:hypothetical protein